MAFRSKLEERVADLMVELGVKYEYESTKIPYVIQHNYTPDFLLPNGIYLECKGYWDADDRRKIKAVKAANPDLDLRMVFQAPFNTISVTVPFSVNRRHASRSLLHNVGMHEIVF